MASPQPLRIVELAAIEALIEAGIVVITAGGGGIPVVADENGDLHGVAAVIDKDLASALLANKLAGGPAPHLDRRREGGAELRHA